MEVALETTGVTKRYGGYSVLENVNITIEKGRIYGFVGRNGAGKTTLLRIIGGLSFQNEGTVSIFGIQNENELNLARQTMGSLIESPALYPNLTARQNLELFQKCFGQKSSEEVESLLVEAGLAHENKKLVKDFSLGMKQRLAISIALLNNPKFLILDEPINGLDPQNIVYVRDSLLKLCHEKGVTILISSHILSELYQLATDYIIIEKGKIVKQLSHDQLDQECSQYISINVNDSKKALQILLETISFGSYKLISNTVLELYQSTATFNEINDILMANHLEISGISIKNESLEEYFLKLIGEYND